MTSSPRPQAICSFFEPYSVRAERIPGGVQIRSESERDERVLEYIGKSQLTCRHVFWDANAKKFEMVAEDRLQFLKEVV